MRTASLFDRFFLIRPSLLVPVWTFLLLGHYHSTPRAPQLAVPGKVLLALLTYSAVMAGVYILNQLTDRESDRLNRKLFLLAEGHLSVVSASIQMALLLAAGTILSILFFSPVFTLFLFLSLVLGILYSLPPFRLKARPFLDLASNAIGYGGLNFAIGWLATDSISAGTVALALPYILAVGGVFVSTTILDIPGDRRVRDRTIGVCLGSHSARWVAALLVGAALLSSIAVGNWICLIASAVSLPFFVAAGLRRGDRIVSLSVRTGPPILVLITAIIYPFFGPVLVVGILLTRWYYKKRFGLVYPSLMEERRTEHLTDEEPTQRKIPGA